MVHQAAGQIHGRLVNPANDIRRRAGLYRRAQHDLRRTVGGVFRPRVRGENDAVAGFEANQRLKNGGGGRIGGGDNPADQADGFGNGHGAKGVIFRQHPAGFLIFIGVVDIFGGKVVFDDFIFHDAHAGLGNRHFGQRNAGIGGGQRGGAEDFIDLLLRKAGIGLLRLSYPRDQGIEVVITGDE